MCELTAPRFRRYPHEGVSVGARCLARELGPREDPAGRAQALVAHAAMPGTHATHFAASGSSRQSATAEELHVR